MPSRRLVPTVGAPASVVRLAARARATIVAVGDGGRELVVVTDTGERMRFALSRATGTFVEEGRQYGARLTLEDWDER